METLAQKKHIKVILLYGQEEALMLEYVHDIKTSLKNYVFTTIDSQNTDYLHELSNEALTSSMFGESKILHIHNFRKLDGKKITDILSKIGENSEHIIILSHPSTIDGTNSIRKLCESTPYFASIGVYSESLASTKNNAKQLMESIGMEFESNIPDILAEMFEGNGSNMKQEIHKLYTYLISKPQVITDELLYNVLQGDAHLNIFDIPTFMLEKNLEKVFKILENAQNDGISPVVIHNTISSYIKKIHSIKKGIANKENIEILLKQNGVLFNQVGIVKKHVSTYSIKDITHFISLINTLEVQTRASSDLAFNSIKNFAANLCS